MIINIALLSLIMVYATRNVVGMSSEASSAQSLVYEEDISSASSSTIHPMLVDDHNNHRETSFKTNQYLHIQYAPLSGRFEKSAGVKSPSKIIAINFESTEEPSEETSIQDSLKTNIAPYFDTQRQSYRSFVPGYNIDVFQSVNRNPGFNAMYLSYPELFEKRNQNYKIRFMGEDMESLEPGSLVTHLLPTKTPLSYPLPMQNEVLKPSLLNIAVEQSMEKVNRPNTPLNPKIHRIHLNLARVYSQGRGIPKLPTHDKDYSTNFRPSKKHVLSFYPGAFDTKPRVTA